MRERFFSDLSMLVGQPTRYRYLLTVSGGADSTVMAHLFHEMGLNFALAHCNFHLRGAESDRDMQIVQQLADSLQVELMVREFDTPSLQKDSGLSMEMMARKLRYDWFEEIGQSFDYIVTAHHANDALETTLLNLCRGAGLRGLASIPAKNNRIIRPLLNFTAAEIRAYAHHHHLPYGIDSTNSDETIRRNRLRHAVVPLLEELNPTLLHTFSHNRQLLQAQLVFYDQALIQVKKEVITEENGKVIINLAPLAKRDKEVKKIILYEFLKEYGFAPQVAEILQHEHPSGRLFLSSGYKLLVDRDRLLIQKRDAETLQEIPIASLEELRQYFEVQLCDGGAKISFSQDNNVLFLPHEKLLFPLVLRHWKEGDLFYPLGAPGRQKLSDFFTDHKIDRFAKEKIWLLCTNSDIIWVVGLRSDERFKIDLNRKIDYYKITYYGFE